MIRPLILSSIICAILGLFFYAFIPAFIWTNLYLFVVTLIACGASFFAVYLLGGFEGRFTGRDVLESERSYIWLRVSLVFTAACCFLFVLGASLLNFLPGQGARLGAVLGTPVVVEGSKLPDLDIQQAPLVPYTLAYRKAQVALASIGSRASQLKVGDLAKQEVNGELRWVAFIEPTGFFRWLSMDGTPGYVSVSASDYGDAKLVMELDGKPLNLKYTELSFFSNDLRRHFWFNSPTTKIDVFSPELDDNGRPYYVASIIEPQVNASGYDTVGVAIVDPQTGGVEHFDLDNVPAWVDIIHSPNLLYEQVDDAGEFVHGRFNWSNLDKFAASSADQVFAKNGASYWVFGITTKQNTLGVQKFFFVDTRTKETFEYLVNGILEERAQQMVHDSHTKDYDLSNPIPFLVNGRPTYVMSLLLGDAIYAYGMVDIESETVFASKPTLTETFQAYLSASTNSGLTGRENQSNETFSGAVFRVGQDLKTGNYRLMLSGRPEVFEIGSGVSSLLVLTQPGDTVKLVGQRFNETTINVVEFSSASIDSNLKQ